MLTIICRDIFVGKKPMYFINIDLSDNKRLQSFTYEYKRLITESVCGPAPTLQHQFENELDFKT